MKTVSCSCRSEPNGNISCHHSVGCHGDGLSEKQFPQESQPVTENTTAISPPAQQEPQSTHDKTCILPNDPNKEREEETSESEGSFLQDSGGYQWCLDDECNKELNVSLILDQQINALSLDQDSLNYDDISKTLDASLAEIDMETFRSEDINSLLSLPGVYSTGSDAECLSLGENCASMSASFLNGFELECSESPHSLSEDESAEGSICKDEPLFSPAKEPLNVNNTSIDSLDCTSLDERSIADTCQANKSNYTIAFEGSGTQLSDDSDMMDMKQKKEDIPRTKMITEYYEPQKPACTSMVQSDLLYTTWEKIKNSKKLIFPTLSAKFLCSRSKSLPSLFKYSLVLAEKHTGELEFKINSIANVPIYKLHRSCYDFLQRTEAKDNKYSIPMFKLFIRNKNYFRSESFSVSPSSCQSGSADGTLSYPTIHPNKSISDNEKYGYMCREIFSVKTHNRETESSFESYSLDTTLVDSESAKEQQTRVYKNPRRQTNMLNAHVNELNNNMVQTSFNNNTNVFNTNKPKSINRKQSFSESDGSSSQYFEDSLVVGPLIKHTLTRSYSIKEEENEQTDEEDLLVEGRDPFGSDVSTSDDASASKNNVIVNKTAMTKPVAENNTVRRINNFLLSDKVEKTLAENICVINHNNKLSQKCTELIPESTSQGTQTKTLNCNVKIPAYFYSEENSTQPLPTLEELLNNSGENRISKNTIHACSGYSVNNTNCVEILCNSLKPFINNVCALTPVLKQKSIVKIATTRSYGTQIPLHVKDRAIQTSFISTRSCRGNFSVQQICTDSSGEKTGELLFPSYLSPVSSRFPSTTESENKTVYVCYPSYSLPDLSFLKNLRRTSQGKDLVYIRSTDNLPTLPISNHNKQVDFFGKDRSLPNTRSLGNIFHQTFSHIKDWESLNVLLPTELKSVISIHQETENGGENHGYIDNDGFHCSCSSDINRYCSEHVRSQNYPEEDFSCSSESVSSITSNSRGNENSHSHFVVSKSENNSRRGILRKSSLTSYCNKQRSRDVGFEMSSHLDFRRLNQLYQCSQSLENATERRMLSENEKYSVKNTETLINNNNIESQTETFSGSKHAVTANKNDLIRTYLDFMEKQGLNNDIIKVHSDENCPTDYVSKCLSLSPIQQVTDRQENPEIQSCCKHNNNNLNTGKKYQKGSQRSLSSITSPVDQLCYQLQLLRNSNTSLNLMTAALSEKPESQDEVNCYSCSRGKKSVTFHDNLDIEVDNRATKDNVVHEVSEEFPIDEQNSEDECENPPEEFVVSPQEGSFVTLTPSSVFSDVNNTPRVALNLKQKTGFLKNIVVGVEQILNCSKNNEEQKQKVLKYLCPAVYSVLANGLLSSDVDPSLVTYSPWKVAEASSCFGHPTKELQDLVNHIAGKNCLVGNTCKFYVFVLGLLNLGIIDWWFLHLTSCEPLIRQHYQPDALLSLLASPLATNLCEEVLITLRPLSTIPFSLDLNVTKRDVFCADDEITVSTPNEEQKPLPPIKKPIVDQIPFSYPIGHKCVLHEEANAPTLKQTSKTNEREEETTRNKTSLQSNNKESSSVKNLEQQKKFNNKSDFEVSNAELQLNKRVCDIDISSVIISPATLNSNFIKEQFEKAVDLAFPSTEVLEGEGQKLKNRNFGKNSNNIIQSKDVFVRNIRVEQKTVQDFEGRCLISCNSQSEKNNDKVKCFENFKRKWEELKNGKKREELTSTPRNLDKAHTITVSKRSITSSPPLTSNNRGKSKFVAGMSKQTVTSKRGTEISTHLHPHSSSQNDSIQQLPQDTSNSLKEIASKGHREPLVKSAVIKPHWQKHPTVKQVATPNESLNVYIKQGNTISALSSPSRKPNLRKAAGRNLNSSPSNSSNSPTMKNGLGISGPKNHQARKSFIPIQNGPRTITRQQKKSSRNVTPCLR